ncbi:uncharacterized protein BJ171DRAFT_577190 [Polychytrium aggregatum]|uniref:uncharacterized protein n=1 Tax=Polychytrium aggregatum TaxID=110093 RepID=UPI0022FE9B54|nr:uncharacterized protein BJ171DRAFT_577190 [Polychytrium aggregatum]KAI9208841.1 hypothetical protein BJ171DRAFT_577190 [Polychytrium aggregatum]
MATDEEDWESAEPIAVPIPPKPSPPQARPAIGSSPITVIEVNGDSRTAYVPQVKILKRDPVANPRPTPVSAASAPTRTLKEKEELYNAARQRIFGSDP